MVKCTICEARPANGGSYCQNCTSRLDAAKRRQRVKQPAQFLTYRGNVVGLYPNGDGKLEAKLLRRNPDHLPKSRTLDLNTYLDGFSRDQVKRLKSCVLQLASA